MWSRENIAQGHMRRRRLEKGSYGVQEFEISEDRKPEEDLKNKFFK
jgi:hypothetical protein